VVREYSIMLLQQLFGTVHQNNSLETAVVSLVLFFCELKRYCLWSLLIRHTFENICLKALSKSTFLRILSCYKCFLVLLLFDCIYVNYMITSTSVRCSSLRHHRLIELRFYVSLDRIGNFEDAFFSQFLG